MVASSSPPIVPAYSALSLTVDGPGHAFLWSATFFACQWSSLAINNPTVQASSNNHCRPSSIISKLYAINFVYWVYHQHKIPKLHHWSYTTSGWRFLSLLWCQGAMGKWIAFRMKRSANPRLFGHGEWWPPPGDKMTSTRTAFESWHVHVSPSNIMLS